MIGSARSTSYMPTRPHAAAFPRPSRSAGRERDPTLGRLKFRNRPSEMYAGGVPLLPQKRRNSVLACAASRLGSGDSGRHRPNCVLPQCNMYAGGVPFAKALGAE